MSLNDDHLRLLSDAEREAMEADDNDYDPEEDNAAALAALGRGPLDAEEEEEGADAGKDKPEPSTATEATDTTAAPAAAPAAVPAAAPAEPTDATQPTDAPAPNPQAAQQAGGYRAELPADYDAQVKANRDAVAAARAKFNEGELEQAELDAELDRLQDQRDTLRDMKTRATMSAEMQAQSAQQAWNSTISGFLDDVAKNPALGIVDYRQDKAKQADLDAMVRALGAAQGNEHKPMRWFLGEGHRRVVALHGIPTTKKPADVQRKPDASAVVTNLADVPGGAGDADPVSDEFAELDKLTGLDYERALAGMSEEKRDRYNRLG
jgi:chemotaxis protein histidine kinase CheA